MSAAPHNGNGHGNGNGNGKVGWPTLIATSMLVVAACGGAWQLVDGQIKHQKELITRLEKRVDDFETRTVREAERIEARFDRQKSDLDTSLQREMRLINDALAKTVEGWDQLSTERHATKDKQLDEISGRLLRMENLNHKTQ